jgi:beta-glucosidase
VAATPEEAAGLAVMAGCNLNCGCTFEHLLLAVGHGWLSESEIDKALALPVHHPLQAGDV